jgi:hypothetical protein
MCALLLAQLMAVGVPISFLVGAGLVYLRLVMAWRTGLKFREWVPGINPRRIHRFAEDFDCEVAARCLMRAWVGGDAEEGAVDPVALDLAENVLKVGGGSGITRMAMCLLHTPGLLHHLARSRTSNPISILP